MINKNDPFNLDRFVKAQKNVYQQALSEIRSGQKTTHWMWYIFPTIKRVGLSSTATFYAISSLEEAEAYIQHPLLRAHLIEITEALLDAKSSNPDQVMGSHLDALKLQSSMTLFADLDLNINVFIDVLKKFFNGQKDVFTLNIIYPRCD